LSSGTVSGAILNGGDEIISAGGIDIRVTVNAIDGPSDGVQTVFGSAVSAHILGGSQTVFSGGTTTGSIITNGGSEIVSSGGKALASIVSSGGLLVVSSGGTMSGGLVVEAGLYISGGFASGVTVSGFGVDVVFFNGRTSGTILQLHGGEDVDGYAQGTIVNSGGSQNVDYGGLAAFSVIKSGGLGVVESNGSVDNATVSSGGYLVVEPGGRVSATVLSGGRVISTGVLIDAGNAGTFTYDTTLASGTQLTSISSEFVLAGGIASANTVSDSTQIVFSGGQTVGDTVSAYGDEAVYAGAKATGTVVGSSGTLQVFSGGTTSGAVVSAGGVEALFDVGTASNTTLAGGTLVISSLGIAAGSINYTASGGNLVISSLVMPTATISGFAAGDRVTLAALPYSSTYKAVVSSAGIVTVSAGAHDYLLHIAGAVVGESNFVLTSAGSGTVLTVSGAVGAATRMSFISPAAVTSEPATERTFLDGALAYHRGPLGDFAPHAASGHVAGAIPDLLIVPRGGAGWFFPHGNHPVFAADP